MENTIKYIFNYTEHTRFGEKRYRTKTLRLSRELFDRYDVDEMLKAFRSEQSKFVYHDSTAVVRTIKVGRTEFQI